MRVISSLLALSLGAVAPLTSAAAIAQTGNDPGVTRFVEALEREGLSVRHAGSDNSPTAEGARLLINDCQVIFYRIHDPVAAHSAMKGLDNAVLRRGTFALNHGCRPGSEELLKVTEAFQNF